MTQLTQAKNKICTLQMEIVSKDEKQTKEYIRKKIALGEIVIPYNKKRKNKKGFKVIGIGSGLKTKVNANIGTSPFHANIKEEIKKMEVSISMGADTIMDLSTGGKINEIRREILKYCNVPLGTVPIYQAGCEISKKRKDISEMTPELMFSVIEEQAEDGVDFMTLHCGITRFTVETLLKSKRLGGIVSRGGSFLARWILKNNRENPLYEKFDRLLDIAYKYDITLSLGDGLRPGCLADASDKPQIAELLVLGQLAKTAREKGVQVMIEGPGHIPLNEIISNVLLEKKLCANAPFYLLGPLVTDIGCGYDHITAAIGGAIAASYGADFLCYVTPAEHLSLPDLNDVKEGVIAARIAAHAGDIVKNIPQAIEEDNKMSKARKNFDWETQRELSLDKTKFDQKRKTYLKNKKDVCSMCGKFCALKQLEEFKI